MISINLLHVFRCCSKCGHEWPQTLTYFSAHKASAGGLRRECRECERKSKDQRKSKITPEQHAIALEKRRARRAARVDHYRTTAKALRARNVEAQRATGRAYYAAHPERGRAATKKWREENKHLRPHLNWKPTREKKYIYHRRWYDKHREERLRYARRYREENPEKVALVLFRYRSRLRKASGDATDTQVKARIEFFGGVCSYCGGPYEHLDHAIALSRGGTNWPANIRPACQHCNQSKGARSAFEFIRWRRALGLTTVFGYGNLVPLPRYPSKEQVNGKASP